MPPVKQQSPAARWWLRSLRLLCPLPLLQGYGFPVNQLFDMLLEIQDQYSETLLKKWAGVFR